MLVAIIILTIVFEVIYHKIFHVVYFGGNAMIKEISAQKTSPEKAQEIANIIAKYFEKDSGTGISYLQRPQEIGARKAEAQAIDRPLYVHLNNIYKKVNAQNPKSKIDSTTILTTTRVFSQAS